MPADANPLPFTNLRAAMGLSVDGQIPSPLTETTVRLVSFNINGYKTLNHYHPWNELTTLSEKLHYLQADIVTLQELKLQRVDVTRSIASVQGYHSFISVPRTKRGYSGVGVFVRNDRSHLYNVIKVEEGITGYLDVHGYGTQTYRKIWETGGSTSFAIGGYTDNLTDWKEAMKLDNEGRCIIIELDVNLVVISLYCPANSMATEEEEERRCLFLQTVLQRVENLKNMGKEVLVMGDINVAPSLIDRDDFMGEWLKDGSLHRPTNGEWFEKFNREKTLEFRNATLSRQILNDYLYDYNEFDKPKNESKILFDLGRFKNPNRLKLYTCWNTLKNNRPMNIGSRIDLFLGTKQLEKSVNKCDIWAFLYGSDHCPIFCDIDLESFSQKEQNTPQCKHFEAVNYYGLGTIKSIASFFKQKPKLVTTSTTTIPVTAVKSSPPSQKATSKRSATVPTYTSRKMQKGQTTLPSLMQKKQSLDKASASSLFIPESDDEDESVAAHSASQLVITAADESMSTSYQQKKFSINGINTLLNGKNLDVIPRCDHQEPCILRTTKKGPNTGRRFWCCAKPTKNETWQAHHDKEDVINASAANLDNSEDFSCSFFKWAQK
jgi:AP endonuclease-2